MPRIQINDLPALHEMTPEQLKELFGAGLFKPRIEGLEQRLLRAADIDIADNILEIQGDQNYTDMAIVRTVQEDDGDWVVRADLFSAENTAGEQAIKDLWESGGFNKGKNLPTSNDDVDLNDLGLDSNDVNHKQERIRYDEDELGDLHNDISQIVFQGGGGNDYFLNFTDAAITDAGYNGIDVSANGGIGDDHLRVDGGAATNLFDGDGGNDYLYAFHTAGANNFYGDIGNDWLWAESTMGINQFYGELDYVEGGIYAYDPGDNDSFSGPEDEDFFYAGNTTGTNLFYGGKDDDSFWAYETSGTNLFYGGSGEDYLRADYTSGVNQFYGGENDDELRAERTTGENQFFGEAGNDGLSAYDTSGVNEFNGGNGDDGFGAAYTSGENQFVGETGNDVFFAYHTSGDNQFDGGAGNDSFSTSLTSGVNESHGGEGDDEFDDYNASGVNLYYGDAGNDYFYALSGTGVNEFHGGEGADEFDVLSTEGLNLIYGDAGNDSLYASSTSGISEFHGGEDDDKLSGSTTLGVFHFYGDAGNDMLFGSYGDDYLEGGVGNDLLIGGGGSDEIHGESGQDMIIGDYIYNIKDYHLERFDTYQGSGNGGSFSPSSFEEWIRSVYGGSDSASSAFLDNTSQSALYENPNWDDKDYIFGGDENDIIFGGGGDDEIKGEGGDDWIFAGSGEDTVEGGDGKDYLYGGQGNDSLHARQVSSGFDYDGGWMFGGGGDDYMYGSFADDYMYGEAGNDFIYSFAGYNFLDGGAGNDIVEGGTDNDQIEGRAGNDLLIGGGGTDQIRGDTGQDMIFGDKSSYRVDGYYLDMFDTYEGLGAGGSFSPSTFDSWIRDEFGVDPLSLSGAFLDDSSYDGIRETSSNAKDFLYGGDENDIIFGGGGDDEIEGEAGDDWIFSGSGNDTAEGGAGDDYLYGGAGTGDDSMDGGDGDDYIDGIQGNFTSFGFGSGGNVGDIEQSLEELAYELDQEYGLISNGEYYLNWGGLNEKWMQGDDDAWYFLTPDGELYRWDGEGDLSASELVATLDELYYADPSKLHDAPPPVTELTGSTNTEFDDNKTDNKSLAEQAYQLDQKYALTSNGKYSENWGGLGEKWIKGGDGSWFFITKDGGLHRWQNEKDLTKAEKVGRLDGSFHADPTKLHDAQTPATEDDGSDETTATDSLSELAYRLDQKYGLTSDGKYSENWGGLGEKWIKGGDGSWFFITRDGALYYWQNEKDLTKAEKVAQLDGTFHADPSKLHDAEPPAAKTGDTSNDKISTEDPLAELAYEVDQKYGLTFTGSYSENWAGIGEKWLKGSDDSWYFITKDGSLHRWNGDKKNVASSPVVAEFDAAYFADPSKLHDAFG